MSHGSKFNYFGVWAKERKFCCYFWGDKGSSISMFFTLHINSPHYRNINNSDFALGLSNLQKRKGIRLGPLFSNQISLVTLSSLLTILDNLSFWSPVHFYLLPSLWITLYNPITYLLIKNDDLHIYIHTFEYFENKDNIGLWSWLKMSNT